AASGFALSRPSFFAELAVGPSPNTVSLTRLAEPKCTGVPTSTTVRRRRPPRAVYVTTGSFREGPRSLPAGSMSSLPRRAPAPARLDAEAHLGVGADRAVAVLPHVDGPHGRSEHGPGLERGALEQGRRALELDAVEDAELRGVPVEDGEIAGARGDRHGGLA